MRGVHVTYIYPNLGTVLGLMMRVIVSLLRHVHMSQTMKSAKRDAEVGINFSTTHSYEMNGREQTVSIRI